MQGTNGNDVLIGGEGDDLLRGKDGDDILHGNGGNDTLEGGGGADLLFGGTGGDVIDGGAGIDWVQYNTATAGVTLSLATGGSAGEAAGDTFSSIESVRGSEFADDLTGDAARNLIMAGAGDDTIDATAATRSGAAPGPMC